MKKFRAKKKDMVFIATALPTAMLTLIPWSIRQKKDMVFIATALPTAMLTL